MAFSFSRLIISESNIETYKEVLELLENKDSKIQQQGNAFCVGEINGNKLWLGFWKGVPSWRCSCTETPYLIQEKPCVHGLALALAWDRDRGVPDPLLEDVVFITSQN